MAFYTKQIALRVDLEDQESIVRLGRRIGTLPTSALLRAALRIGIRALESNPALLVDGSLTSATAAPGTRKPRKKTGRR